MTADTPPTAPRSTPARIRIDVASPPDPARLRAALRTRLAGHPFPAGVEAEVADQVRAALARREEGAVPWR
jgi:hypothetical protein